MLRLPLPFLAALAFAACADPAGDPDNPDAGAATADAVPAPDAGPSPDAAPPGELRGVWITRFAYSSADQLEGIIDRAAAANFNAVFVQVRGNGDAYYESTVEPWARNLSGVLGRDPGWDPLQVAIDRARDHGLEIHAYINVLAGWPAGQAPVPVAEGAIQHPLRDHPEWLAVDSTGDNQDGEYLWLSPGNPEVRAHTVAVVEDLLGRYDVDGLHLDRIRTAGPDYSRDAVTEAAFEAALELDPDLEWADFMREQVSLVVDDIHDAITRTRPSVRHSAAVWGIHQPLPGCSTSHGYGQYYQDSLAWIARDSMDALVPMMYWPIQDGACTDWATLLDVFMAGSDRHVWGGMHALEGGSDFDPAAIAARIEYARQAGAQGTVVFASSYLDTDTSRWDTFTGDGPYAEPIATPAMPWKP